MAFYQDFYWCRRTDSQPKSTPGCDRKFLVKASPQRLSPSQADARATSKEIC